jgi:hypothetical protein
MTEFLLAAILVVLSYMLQGRIGLNLADEGFLWNGSLRIEQGKIPIRDYKSYDPGRFYWCYGLSKVFGLGILGIRRSVSVFQVLGLWAGLMAASRAVDHFWLLVIVGMAMVLWMEPRHKVFEHAISLGAVYLGVILLEIPTDLTLFLAGVFVGLAAFMGRNHGLYCLTGFAVLILILWPDVGLANLVWKYGVWISGIVLGYSPMLLLWVFVPGMLSRYWNDKVMVFARRGSANLRLPVPWPWRKFQKKLSLPRRLYERILGTMFLVIPLLYLIVIVWVTREGEVENQPLMVSSVVFGLLYLHHAFSRADPPHLAQSIQPFLLTSLAVVSTQNDPIALFVVTIGLAIVGFLVLFPILPFVSRWKSTDPLVDHDLNGERLSIPRSQSIFLSRLNKIINQHLEPSEPLFIAPNSATLYAVLRKETPVRSDYMLFPETEAIQQETIKDVECNCVNWALIQDHALDRRDDLRFHKTHEYIWQYLQEQFEQVPMQGISSYWTLWKRRDY